MADGDTELVGVLDEVDFPDLRDSIQQVLGSALQFVSDVAQVFQVSLISRRDPYAMKIRYYAIGDLYKPYNGSKNYLDDGVPFRKGENKSLLWDVIAAETKAENSADKEAWLEPIATSVMFSGSNLPVKKFYLADEPVAQTP